MTLRDEIAQQALSLPPEDRMYVADVLEKSLTTGDFSTPELAAEWADEIERRIAAYDRGELTGVDFNAALDRIQQQLAEQVRNKANP
jgi:hypothetical protein